MIDEDDRMSPEDEAERAAFAADYNRRMTDARIAAEDEFMPPKATPAEARALARQILHEIALAEARAAERRPRMPLRCVRPGSFLAAVAAAAVRDTAPPA